MIETFFMNGEGVCLMCCHIDKFMFSQVIVVFSLIFTKAAYVMFEFLSFSVIFFQEIGYTLCKSD